MGRCAVILSGCGYLDGAEIHESVLCFLALAGAGHSYQSFAPDVLQAKVVNHLNQEEVEETRSVLVESARICRSEVKDLVSIQPQDFDALLLPGGFGAALNLSNFAKQGTDCEVLESLQRIVLAFFEEKKPIGATCIAPVALAKIFQGKVPLRMTLGSSPEFAEYLKIMGHRPVLAGVADLIVDEENRVYTTPCYMEPPDLAGMFEGVKKLVARLFPNE